MPNDKTLKNIYQQGSCYKETKRNFLEIKKRQQCVTSQLNIQTTNKVCRILCPKVHTVENLRWQGQTKTRESIGAYKGGS